MLAGRRRRGDVLGEGTATSVWALARSGRRSAAYWGAFSALEVRSLPVVQGLSPFGLEPPLTCVGDPAVSVEDGLTPHSGLPAMMVIQTCGAMSLPKSCPRQLRHSSAENTLRCPTSAAICNECSVLPGLLGTTHALSFRSATTGDLLPPRRAISELSEGSVSPAADGSVRDHRARGVIAPADIEDLATKVRHCHRIARGKRGIARRAASARGRRVSTYLRQIGWSGAAAGAASRTP
jgi:hypothetical protein